MEHHEVRRALKSAKDALECLDRVQVTRENARELGEAQGHLIGLCHQLEAVQEQEQIEKAAA